MASCAWISLKVKRTSRLATTATADDDACLNRCVVARCGDGILRALTSPKRTAASKPVTTVMTSTPTPAATPARRRCGDGVVGPGELR